MRRGLQITSYIKSLERLSDGGALKTDSLIVLGKLKGLRNRKKKEGNLAGNSPDFSTSSLQNT